MKKITAMAAAVAIGVLGGFGPASASNGAVAVGGTQTPVDPVLGIYRMDGDLIGDWYTTSFNELGFTASGALRGAGTELFVGCYDADGSGACDGDDPAGTMTLSFTYTARYDMTTGLLLHGRCHHPITGGTDGFEGASGVLSFHDDPATGCSTYRGNLRL